MYSCYLTETLLEEFLKHKFINGEWIHNKKFLNYFPDYRNEYYKLIVEFDGYHHFNIIMNNLKINNINIFNSINNSILNQSKNNNILFDLYNEIFSFK